MICKNCGVENKEHALFCSGCGQKLKNVCPNCNYENEDGSKFCIKCGTRLDESSKKTKTKNVNSSINTNNVLNLITKILKITSFSLCLILILLTIGASFTNILSGVSQGSDILEQNYNTMGSLNLFSIIDNITNFKINEEMCHYEYSVIGDLSMNIVLLVCVLAIMITSSICLIVAIVKIAKQPRDFVSLEHLVMVMFGVTLGSVLVASLMRLNVTTNMSILNLGVNLTVGGFIKACVILDFCVLLALHIIRFVLDMIANKNYKYKNIISEVLKLGVIVFFFIGGFSLTNSVVIIKDASSSYLTTKQEYSIGAILMLLCKAAYDYCNLDSNHSGSLPKQGEELMTKVIIGYVVAFFVVIVVAIFLIRIIKKLNQKESYSNIIFTGISLVLAIVITITFSQCVRDTALIIQNDFSSFRDNVITYPDYSIGSALITPIVMFSLSLICSIVDLVISKINTKNEIE